jgi:hypothetical protein
MVGMAGVMAGEVRGDVDGDGVDGNEPGSGLWVGYLLGFDDEGKGNDLDDNAL